NQPATLARVGAQLGAFELVAIEPRGVLLRNADGECWLRLVGDPIARAQRKTAPPARAASKDDKKKKKKKSEVVVIGRR
ncbi:MAG TPA: hypothetical protein VJR89_38960, partial [Polyangiales bacterium]|nr:hypothetical protein [Polyangiales bacterium]